MVLGSALGSRFDVQQGRIELTQFPDEKVAWQAQHRLFVYLHDSEVYREIIRFGYEEERPRSAMIYVIPGSSEERMAYIAQKALRMLRPPRDEI